MMQLITSCRSWQSGKVVKARCWHPAWPLPRLQIPAWSLCLPLSPRLHTIAGSRFVLVFFWHAKHTHISLIHTLYSLLMSLSSTPHAFVGSFLLKVTNKHFCWNLKTWPVSEFVAKLLFFLLFSVEERKPSCPYKLWGCATNSEGCTPLGSMDSPFSADQLLA